MKRQKKESNLAKKSEESIAKASRPELDSTIEELIAILEMKNTRFLTGEEAHDDLRKRQDAINKFLLPRGGSLIERFFNRVKDKNVRLDLSMISLAGYLLEGLRLRYANLEKISLSGCNITGSDITAGILREAVATEIIMDSVIGTGTNFTAAVMPRASLRGGRFVGAIFTDTIMYDALVDSNTNFAGAVFIRTDLRGVDMSLPNTSGALFRDIIT